MVLVRETKYKIITPKEAMLGCTNTIYMINKHNIKWNNKYQIIK